MQKINTKIVRSINEYLSAIYDLHEKQQHMGFIYRGQENANWEIISSARRRYPNYDLVDLRKYHEYLLYSARAIHDSPDEQGDLLLLVHCQHQGIPTCLIDYTHDPLTALFFATTVTSTQSSNSDAAVYVLDSRLEGQLVDKLSPNDTCMKLFSNPGRREAFPAALFVFEPAYINRRVLIQNGVLVYSPNEKQLKNLHDLQIIIPKESKELIQKQLEVLGYNKQRIYPDFAGLREWFSFGDTEKEEIRIRDYSERAYEHYLIGNYDDALVSYFQVLEIKKNILDDNHTDTAVTYCDIADVLFAKGDLKEALKYYKEALNIQTTTMGSDSIAIAHTYDNYGSVFLELGEYEKALEQHEKALAIYKKRLMISHPFISWTYYNIGRVYDAIGKYKQALKYYNLDLQVCEEVFGKEHPETAKTYNVIGNLYYNINKFEQALKFYDQALIIQEKILGQQHPRTGDTYNNIGEVLEIQGEYEEALKYYKKSLNISLAANGENSSETAISYNNIGGIYRLLGEREKSWHYYQEALKIREDILGENHPDTAKSYSNIALLHEEEKLYKKALEYYTKSAKIFIGILGKEHKDTQLCIDNIKILLKKGRLKPPNGIDLK